MRGLALAVIVATLALVASGSAATSSITALKVTYWPRGEGSVPRTWTLRCDPASGTLERPAVACRKLSAGGWNLFKPVPRAAVCTAIYGGPDTARVVGGVVGRRVWASFSLTNGCHIERWGRFSPWLLPSS